MTNEYCNLTFNEWALFFLSVLFDILLFVSVLVNSNLFPPPLYVLIEMLPTKVPVTVDSLIIAVTEVEGVVGVDM